MLDSVFAPLILAFVISLDAFSVCLGIGLQPLRLRKIASIGLWIGIFHMTIPLFGLIIGALLTSWVTHLTELLSGLLLFGLGAHMIFQTFAEQVHSTPPKKFTLPAIIILAFSVSIDSFPIGITLGMSGIRTIFTILLFGGVSTFMALLSLLIGKKVQHNFDRSFAWIGGIILCLFGLIIIF